LSLIEVRDLQEISGLTVREWVVLHGRLRSSTYQIMQGYSGSWTSETTVLSNAYFGTLLNNTWQLQTSIGGLNEYASTSVYMTPEDVALIWDPEYLAIVQEYASNNTLFLEEFANAWTTLVNIDRFDGPTGNLCSNIAAASVNIPTASPATNPPPVKVPATSSPTAASAFVGTSTVTKVSADPGIWIMVGVVVFIGVGFLVFKRKRSRDD
jgi:hypothetical protein